jgi:Ser/Thr protein kinase RdoA (MazF antagonist)
MHQTFLLQTTRGRYALRAYRHLTRERIAREHALIRFAAAHGQPAPQPLQRVEGSTLWEQAGRFYALFPLASGQQVPRARLGAREIAAMGTFLGQLHRALQDYPHDQVSARSFTADLPTTLARIEQLVHVIRGQSHQSDVDHSAVRRLAERRAWLEHTAGNVPTVAHLPTQVIHGDYQETNLFFGDGRISAIIDWDQAYAAPRAWEVLRVFHLVFQFAPMPSRAFLRAYQSVLPLSTADLQTAAACYCHLRTHDLWVYEATYLEGNTRTRAFIHDGPFTPLDERWAQLQPALFA